MRLLLFQIPGQLLFSVASQLALIVLAGTITALAVRGQIGAPEAVALLIVTVRFLEPFTVLGRPCPRRSRTRAGCSPAFAASSMPPGACRLSTAAVTSAGNRTPRIEFRDVGFRLRRCRGRFSVLAELNFVLEPGTDDRDRRTVGFG